MSDLPGELRIHDVVLGLLEAEGVACWSGELPRAEHAMVSLMVEPPSAPLQEALETTAGVIERFDELVEVAVEYLATELRSGECGLLDVDRARLAQAPPPFGLPEATVWSDGTWLLRFADVDLERAGDLGLAVRFVGTAPVAVDDLSEADPDPDGDPV